MAIDLTPRTRRALDELSIEPNLIVRIDGLSTLFSAVPVREFITYGYPDIFYGDADLYYGGLIDKEDQKNYLDSQSTTFTIRQQINYDDESGASSISSMNIGLVDKNGEVSQLISPGFDLEDILGRKIEVFNAFGESDFFEDAILVFKGFVTKIDSGSGIIKFKINHPDNKKQVKLFKTTETKLTANINASQTSFVVVDASNFQEPVDVLSTYLRIGDEIMQYTTVTGNTISGITRGVLGTNASSHELDDQVRAIYALEDNPFDLALKLMMSGFGTDPIHEGIEVSSFVKVGAGTTQIANAIYFDQINIVQDFGLTVGDTIDISGATNGANNFTGRTITEIERFESGFYIVVDGAALVLEDTTAAVMDTFSQWNVLPDGARMKPEEVDIEEHLKIRDFFFSSAAYRFFLKEDEIDLKEFLDEQIYRPIACYSIPRKTKSSVGYTIGPIPGENIQTLDLTSVKDPRNITITRTTNRSFFNEVVYKYDDDVVNTSEKFQAGDIFISQTSKNRIPGTSRTYVVNSQGLRTDLNAQNIAASNSNRILDRYKFGAEIVNLKALLRDSVALEIGDIVVGEFEDLKVTDISQGSRQFKPRLFEVQNKSINLKNGDVEFTLLDTGLNIATRYGLMSPCSVIAGVISSSQFVIKADPFYPAKFGVDEYRKWEKLLSINEFISIRVHNADYSVDEDLVVTGINENTFTLQTPATITLVPGLTVEFTGYADIDTSDKQKLIYGYMTDDPNFGDGGEPYSMI